MSFYITSLCAILSSVKPSDFLPTDNSLFSSGNDSDSVESKENGALATKTHATSKQVSVGSGLFDDEDDDDDFFSGKSLKKSDSGKCVGLSVPLLQFKFRCRCSLFLVFSCYAAGQEKPKPKKAIDLFDDDDDDGDIFSEKYSAPAPAQSKKEVVVVEEQVKTPEKKVKINIQVSGSV